MSDTDTRAIRECIAAHTSALRSGEGDSPQMAAVRGQADVALDVLETLGASAARAIEAWDRAADHARAADRRIAELESERDALVGRLQTLEAALALTEPLMMAVMIRSEPLPGTIQERASALYEFLTAHPEIVTPPAVLRKEGTP